MANTNSEAIMYHHGTSDPTDYQVDDVLVCVATGYGLKAGELYVAQAVARRKTRGRVVTAVTVTANSTVIEILHAEGFLRRTRVVAEIMSPDGQVRPHSLPDPEQLDVWCAFSRTPPQPDPQQALH